VRHDGDDLGGARILQCADHDEQADKLVARALRPVAVQRVADRDALAAHVVERANLELAVGEVALLVGTEADAELGGDRGAEHPGRVQAEDLHGERPQVLPMVGTRAIWSATDRATGRYDRSAVAYACPAVPRRTRVPYSLPVALIARRPGGCD